MKKCPIPGCWALTWSAPELTGHLFDAHRIPAEAADRWTTAIYYGPGLQLVAIAGAWWSY